MRNAPKLDGSHIAVYPYGQGISAEFTECRLCGGRIARRIGRDTHLPCEQTIGADIRLREAA